MAASTPCEWTLQVIPSAHQFIVYLGEGYVPREYENQRLRHSFLLLLLFVTPSLLMHLIVAPVVNPTLPSLWAEPKNYRYLSVLA